MLPAEWHTAAVVAVFATVYLGMFLGRLPTLKLDRAGVNPDSISGLADLAKLPTLHQAQVWLVRERADGAVEAITRLQTPGALDDL